MKGYKAFNKDWTCNGKVYEVGQTFVENGDPILCSKGMHFCARLPDVFKYYVFDNTKTVVAEIDALGKIDSDGEKYCTNKLHVIREIQWEEVLELANKGSNNTGFGNAGQYNSGIDNSGNWNCGNRNDGHRNTGNGNSGNRNSGNCNSGHYNTGNGNGGDKNSGDNNSGNLNTGHQNTGDRNSGEMNIGDSNTGVGNFGSNNAGSFNTGHANTGDYNNGLFNSSNHNTGDYNSGDWNVSSHNCGCFMTKDPTIMMFNKESNWTYDTWERSAARYILDELTLFPYEFMGIHRMSNAEKLSHPEYKSLGGYIRINDAADRQERWNMLELSKKKVILSLPNFDPDIFKECTGIDTTNGYKNTFIKKFICRIKGCHRIMSQGIRREK